MRKCACLTIVLAAFGVAFLVAGFVILAEKTTIINNKVKENVELKQGTLVFKNWEKPTSPFYMQYFVFHVLNPDEVLAGKEIPHVEQRGPYSYREIRSNDVRNWSTDKTEVTFMPNRTYVFDPSTSCVNCSDNDTFTTVNIPLLTTANWLKETDFIGKHYFCWALLKPLLGSLSANTMNLFYKKTVKEILWGYEDLLLKEILLGHKFLPSCPVPDGLNDFIQLQYNNTYYGISAVNTGAKDIDKLEQYTMWRNEDKLSWWMDNYTNMINGTDGSQFKPGLSKTDILYAFVPEVCRSIYMKYSSTVKVKDITVYRFKAPDEVYLSGDVYPPNKGFCVPPGCLPTGLLNLTLCQPQNPPVAVSPPHFYQGNKTLVEAVKGLNPVASEHETFLDIEPITGITMQAKRRIQVNVHVKPVDVFKYTNYSFKPVFLPVMYVNESALISKDDAAEFKKQVYDQIDLLDGVEYGLIGLGGLLFLIATVILIVLCVRSSRDKDEKLLAVGESNKTSYGATA